MVYTYNLAATQFINFLRLSLILAMLAFSNLSHAEEPATGFDHFSTGFPLIGRHEFIDCADCHIAGQFKGTPMKCSLCHDGIRAPGKHIQHFPSSDFCDDCHTERTWIGARFDHIEIQQACQNCHNNIIATGKSPSHILTGPVCDDCHNTITFDRVGRVDHSSVIGLCTSCHNGVTATGKNPGHIPTDNEECNYCHTVFSWLPAANKPIPRP
jgi:hypothetical protein